MMTDRQEKYIWQKWDGLYRALAKGVECQAVKEVVTIIEINEPFSDAPHTTACALPDSGLCDKKQSL